MSRLIKILFIALFSLQAFQCSRSSSLSGGVSEETNATVRGIIVDSAGLPAASVRVLVLPVDYNPFIADASPLPPAASDTTDSSGAFEVTLFDRGLFNLEGIHMHDFRRLLIRDIQVSEDSLRIRTDTIRNPAALIVPITPALRLTYEHVFFHGMSISGSIGPADSMPILDVPRAVLPPLYCVRTGATGYRDVPLSGQIVIDRDTVVLDSALYRLSKAFFVAANGNDANDGTPSAPFHTITFGLSVVEPGDTLYVRRGAYAEGEIPISHGGASWSSPITITAAPGDTPVVQCFSFADTAAYVIIDGFIIDAQYAWDFGIQMDSSSYNRIGNTEIRNARRNGIKGIGNNNEFINLTVHHIGRDATGGYACYLPGYCHGINIQGDDNTIAGGSYYENDGYGVHVYRDPDEQVGAPDRIVVRNIRAYNNPAPGIGILWGIENKVYNNLLYNNNVGLLLSTYASLHANNTIYGNQVCGISAGGAGNIIRNNIVFNNGGGNDICDSTYDDALDHNLTLDPLFTNATAGDFHLRSNSPAIDSGVAIPEIISDYDNVARPQGTAYDIGAYEQ